MLFRGHVKTSQTPSGFWDTFVKKLDERAAVKFRTPGELAQYLDPRTVQTPMLRFLDKALVELATQPDGRLGVSCPPQEGKSQRASKWYPLWRLMRDPYLRIGIASYEHTIARRWARDIRDLIIAHPELGLKIRPDFASSAEWQLDNGVGGVFAVGVGGAMTGRPLDLLIIDDPIKDSMQADSEVYRDRVWDWWNTVAQTRLSPGATVMVIMTRWNQDDLLGRLTNPDDDVLVTGLPWTVINIPAQAVGDNDPLGRKDGEWLVSARGRTPQDWENRKAGTDPRGWAALYQGNPRPEDGGLFEVDDWEWWTGMPPVGAMSQYIMSWDMTFKDTKASDFVVGQFWLRTGANCYLIDQVRGRMSFTKTLSAFEDFVKKWPMATVKLVEDKANGSAVISSLKEKIPGILTVNPKGSKYARAAAISPFQAAHNLYLPKADDIKAKLERGTKPSWQRTFVDEAADFPNGGHDDQVDAMSQALAFLLLPMDGIGGRLYNIG